MELPSPELLDTAQKGFEAFCAGLATGEWERFIAMLSDDFTFSFPVGSYKGVNVGKEKAAAFFAYASQQVFSEGLIIELERRTYNATTVVFEGRSTGRMFGKPYENQVAVSFEARNGEICSYREYLAVVIPPETK
ncbi:nuclear transport factor 2 family protein [Lusitaniella coriacea LEGE 07157]|uniref:Nuclear transport factor 2 family protein n=1 Tax=Lusitaniella coriacea LEGE 07157 TaxID=945747 RepID=A0A8J7IT98_9CYAN|nr:nuclear transport factor 2 family protein [Lusitaniella coriacea]MBE9115723.1 nuclear transport factor 2 family protein [Lusitaniella coriacea LEGE 07157]